MKLKEEEDLLEEELQIAEEEEELSVSPRKPKASSKFHRMVSYRPQGAIGDEIEEKIVHKKVKYKQKQTSDTVPYLLCVDPTTKSFFRLDLNTFDGSHEIIADPSLDKIFKDKISSGLDIIKKICKCFRFVLCL